jgi:4'-phosphopantetheinyl transferase
MLDLDRVRIDLWLVFVDDIRDEGLLRCYHALMTPEEQQQQGRFYFPVDRKRYLVTRALLRAVLSRYAAIEPKDWAFVANAYGRPAIANADQAARRISFNLSHTNNLILLGVACELAIGVDVENYLVRQPSVEIAERFFAPDEVTDLRAVPQARRHERFFEYWTLKESYIKARAMGLSIPLDRFSFHFGGDAGVGLSMDPDFDDHPSRWRFWQFRPATGYLAAVCVEREADVIPRLTVRKIIPLAHEEPLEYARLRTSAI